MKQENFYNAIQELETKKEIEQFLTLTFTEKELAMMQERWSIFEGLSKGLSQRAIAQENNCSVVTVTRGAKAYRKNEETVEKYLKILSQD